MVLIDADYLEQRFGVSSATKTKRNRGGAKPLPSCCRQASDTPLVSYDAVGGDADEAKLTPQAAWAKLLRLLSVRDRSVDECRRKLVEAGFGDAAISYAVDRALAAHYLDDVRFADYFVRARIAAGKGRVGIERALAEHHIDPEMLPGYPEEYFEGESQCDAAVRYLHKHPTRAKNLWQSAYGKLARAGYSRDVCGQAASRWVAEIGKSRF